MSSRLLRRASRLPLRLQPRSSRTLVAAPRPNSGPLLERRADRALPELPSSSSNHWTRTLPIFGAVMLASCLAIFNYQKTSSPVITSNMYALRTNPAAREILGDEVYFASAVPWIRGSIDQLHGRVDVRFWVKGTRAKGLVRFRSERVGRMGKFETLEWSLQPDGGEKVSLLQAEDGDPFQA